MVIPEEIKETEDKQDTVQINTSQSVVTSKPWVCGFCGRNFKEDGASGYKEGKPACVDCLTEDVDPSIRTQESTFKTGQPPVVPKKRSMNKKSWGSIVALFDKTDDPKEMSDVFCPHFMVLKPYNGCKFDCQWCLDGNTKIMMGDLSWKPLANISIDDYVMGFKRDGSTKLVRTPVLATRQTVKERVKLTTDEAEIISSIDHRFLSYLGRWATAKHLALADGGIKFLIEPTERVRETESYMSSYLQGVTDGDGSHGEYESNGQKQYKYRLAMKDSQAIDRAKKYFRHFGIDMKRFQHKAGSGTMLDAIRKDGKNNYDAIMDIIHKPIGVIKEHYAGYLAGIFDAEGSYSNGILRIANTDKKILRRIKEAVVGLGFYFQEENHSNHVPVIRITGGVKEHIRLFTIINPAITRKTQFPSLKFDVTSPIKKIERLGPGPLYDIQTGTENFIANGLVSHNCYLNGTFRHKKELARKPYLKDKREIVKHLDAALCYIDEPTLFNVGEVADGQLFPNVLERNIMPIFRKYEDKGHKILILTKDDTKRLISTLNAPEQVVFAWSINADAVSRRFEKLAPTLRERLSAARLAAGLGYEVRLRIDPMVPVERWDIGYKKLCREVMDFAPHTEVITLGSLRGLRSTLMACKLYGKDTSWTNYLHDETSWGLRVPEDTRLEMYNIVTAELLKLDYKGKFGLCKESMSLWAKYLKLDFEASEFTDQQKVGLILEAIDKAGMKCNCMM